MGKGGERPGMNSRTGNSSWGSGKGSEAKTTVVRGVKRKEKDSNGFSTHNRNVSVPKQKIYPIFFSKAFLYNVLYLEFFWTGSVVSVGRA